MDCCVSGGILYDDLSLIKPMSAAWKMYWGKTLTSVDGWIHLILLLLLNLTWITYVWYGKFVFSKSLVELFRILSEKTGLIRGISFLRGEDSGILSGSEILKTRFSSSTFNRLQILELLTEFFLTIWYRDLFTLAKPIHLTLMIKKSSSQSISKSVSEIHIKCVCHIINQ